MNNPQIPFGFNTPESSKDYRDIKFEDVAMSLLIPKTYFVDVSKIPVTMQYKRGSCVAHATAKRKEKQELDDSGNFVALSPRFLYAIIKEADGNTSEGTAIRNGLKLLNKTGICTEATYPSDYPEMSHFEFMDGAKIPPEAFLEASKYKDQSYSPVYNLSKDTLKQAIMQGNGVIARVAMSKNWWTDKNGNVTWNEQALMPLRPVDENNPNTGGHAVWIYGFDGDRFWGRNSWSDKWGAKGDFYFDWDVYGKDITEAWTSVDIDNDKIVEVRKLPEHKPLTRNLGFMMTGDDVLRVQKVLGVTPQTGYFWYATLKAVTEFQKKHGIHPGKGFPYGFIGERTRAKLNELYFS